MEQESKYNKEDEIDLLKLFHTIWKGRKSISRFIMTFGLIGLFIAVFSAKEYTAFTIVVPQTSQNKVGGNLGGLAAMAGINLGNNGSTESIPLSLYPTIVKSIPFQKELLKVPLKFSNLEGQVTYEEYYTKHRKFNLLSFIRSYTLGLPGKILSLFKKERVIIAQESKDSIHRVSPKEKSFFQQLQKQLVINNNIKEGFLKISFSMPEALPSAQMVKKSKELLQKSITKFKIQKAQEDFKFIEQRYKEVKDDFIKKRAMLASFRDRNQGLITSRSQSRLKQLESEYNLAYTIYSELAKQLETQKIKLKEDTPIFTTIEPVSVPVDKSKPKRGVTIALWLFLGFFIGIATLFVRLWINNLKNE